MSGSAGVPNPQAGQLEGLVDWVGSYIELLVWRCWCHEDQLLDRACLAAVHRCQ